MDSPNDFNFLNPELTEKFNPSQENKAGKLDPVAEGEFITCQTYPKPKQPLTEEGCLNVLNLKYRGGDFSEAQRIASADNMGNDYSLAGVCQLVDGVLKVLNWSGEPSEDLAKSPDDYDY